MAAQNATPQPRSVPYPPYNANLAITVLLAARSSWPSFGHLCCWCSLLCRQPMDFCNEAAFLQVKVYWLFVSEYVDERD